MHRTTQEWKQLLEEATPGDWKLTGYGPVMAYTEIIGAHGDEIAQVFPEENVETGDTTFCDAEVLVTAKEAVAEVIRLREENDRLRESHKAEMEAIKKSIDRQFPAGRELIRKIEWSDAVGRKILKISDLMKIINNPRN